jgi:hypothetical protein
MSADRDWNKELSKIDRQLESISDEALFPQKANAPAPQQAQVTAKREGTKTWGVFLRLALVTALGVGVLFWPYESRCGLGLAGYLLATSVIGLGGVWSAVWSWRHRSSRAHVLALLLVLWGGILTAMEILPRVGYAKPDPTRPAGWVCS